LQIFRGFFYDKYMKISAFYHIITQISHNFFL